MSDQPQSPSITPGPGVAQVMDSPVRGPVPALLWFAANFEEVVSALLLGVMLASVGAGVFCRYLLQKPLSWTEEVVLMCMVWLVFLGASVATKYKEHIIIDFVVALVPRTVARLMEVVATVAVIGVLLAMVWQGVELVQRTQFMTTTALGMPTMYMYSAVPFSAVLMIIHNLRHLLSIARQGQGG